jgi:prepilin-type N-terminal cleavage/methylation domain-containing protein
MRYPAFGFTLIELLIVIALIGVLAAASIPVFIGFTSKQRLTEAAQNVRADLRSAQNRAISGVGGSAWGIYFGNGDSSYTPFSCPSSEAPNFYHHALNSNCTDLALVSLGSNISVSSVSKDIAFDLVTGDVYVNGALLSGSSESIDLLLGSATRSITISSGGQIE